MFCTVFVFKSKTTTVIITYLHTLSLPDALPIWSAVSAHFFSRCRETLFEQTTEVVTAAGSVLGSRDLGNCDIWLFSAGADNTDSMACLVAARARGGRIHIVTRNPDGLAAVAARTDPNSRVFILPVVDAKDGFLATHSLLATVLAL